MARFLIEALAAFALIAGFSCDKPATRQSRPEARSTEVASVAVAQPVAKGTCETVLARAAMPSDLTSFAVVGASGKETVIAESTVDHFKSTTYEVALEPFIVRYTLEAPHPSAGALEVREASCNGAPLRSDPYWNGGPLTLMRRGEVFAITWRPGGAGTDVALLAFRRTR